MNKTSLVVIIFADGDRQQFEIQNPLNGREWSSSMRTIGMSLFVTPQRQYVAGAVVINGTDVFHYNRTEAAEVLGIAG